MSILETVDKVRKAEEEADRLLEEARRRERAAVEEALLRRKGLLEAARREAEEAVNLLRRHAEEEKKKGRDSVRAAAEAEKNEIRTRAGLNADEAARRALKIFLSSIRGEG